MIIGIMGDLMLSAQKLKMLEIRIQDIEKLSAEINVTGGEIIPEKGMVNR